MGKRVTCGLRGSITIAISIPDFALVLGWRCLLSFAAQTFDVKLQVCAGLLVSFGGTRVQP